MRRRRTGRDSVVKEQVVQNTWEDPTWACGMALGPDTSIRNRTAEFVAATEAVRASLPGKAHGKEALPIAPRSRSDFTCLAAQVGKDIQQTSIKLSTLTKLAQRRSLFDDPTAEIRELTFVIKQDIAALNAKLSNLQSLRDAQRRHSSKQAGDHSESVVSSLKGRLATTAEGFKQVLKMRSESLVAQQDRRSQFLGNSLNRRPVDPSSSSVAINLGGGSLGADVQGKNFPSNSESDYGLSLVQARPENSYQQARADAVRQVESTIVELGQIFNQLATMVSEQGELVERIDANVEDTVMNVNAGHDQLIRYFNNVAGNRALILKVFGVLLFFLILWAVIF